MLHGDRIMIKDLHPNHRELIIVRHAKSSWADLSCPDHRRPLKKRGRKDARWIGEQLDALQWAPDFVVGSDAVRIRETFERLTTTWTPTGPVTWSNQLYLCDVKDVLDILSDYPQNTQSVMCLLHNPTCEEMIEVLCGHSLRITTGNITRMITRAPSWQHALDKPWLCTDIRRPRPPRDIT